MALVSAKKYLEIKAKKEAKEDAARNKRLKAILEDIIDGFNYHLSRGSSSPLLFTDWTVHHSYNRWSVAFYELMAHGKTTDSNKFLKSLMDTINDRYADLGISCTNIIDYKEAHSFCSSAGLLLYFHVKDE